MSSVSTSSPSQTRILLLIGLTVLTVLIATIGTLGYFIYSDTKLSVRDVTVTNVTDTAFTLTWVSDKEYDGKVYYQEGAKAWPTIFAQSGKEIAYDDRDVELNKDGEYELKGESAKKRYTHHVTLRNLKPETEYTLRIGGRINGKEPVKDLKVKTSKLIEDLKTPDPAYGKVEGAANGDSFIYLSAKEVIEGENPVSSAAISANGTYTLDMNGFKLNEIDATKLEGIIYSGTKKIKVGYDAAPYKPLQTIVVADTTSQSLPGITKVVTAQGANTDCDGVTCGEGASCDPGQNQNNGFFCKCNNGKPGGFKSAGYTKGQNAAADNKCADTTPPSNSPTDSNGSGGQNGTPPTTSPPSNTPTAGQDDCSLAQCGENAKCDPGPNKNNKGYFCKCSDNSWGSFLRGGYGNGVAFNSSHNTCGATAAAGSQTQQPVTPQEGCEFINKPQASTDTLGTPSVLGASTQCPAGQRPTSNGIQPVSNPSNNNGIPNCSDVTYNGYLFKNDMGDAEANTIGYTHNVSRKCLLDGTEVNYCTGTVKIASGSRPIIGYAEGEAGLKVYEYGFCGSSIAIEVPLSVTYGSADNNCPEDVIFFEKSYDPTYITPSIKSAISCRKNGENKRYCPDGAQILNIGDHQTCIDSYDAAYQAGSKYINIYYTSDNSCRQIPGRQTVPTSCLDEEQIGMCHVDLYISSIFFWENTNRTTTSCDSFKNKYSGYELIQADLDTISPKGCSCELGGGSYSTLVNTRNNNCADLVNTGQLYCSIASPGNNLFYISKQNSAGNINNVVNQASAQSLTPAGPRVLGEGTTDKLEATESGRYVFFQDGEKVAEQDILVSGGAVEIKMYVDTNANGQKDADEEYLSDYSRITLAKEASAESFSLNSGWNLVNFPLVDTRKDNPVQTAKALIDYWNKQGTDIIHIARYRNGKFEMYSKREGNNEFAEDFDLVPGIGYFIYNIGENRVVSFSGNKVESAVELTLNNGWNLVGVIAPGTEYKSDTLLKKVAEQGINASTLSQYENGLYRSVISENDTIFGNNFNVIDKRGYFIKVEAGGGKKFKP